MTLSPRQYRVLSWLAIGALFFGLIWLLGPILTPFIVSVVMAYALQPAVEKLTQRRVPRWLAVTVVEVLALIVIAAVFLMLVPIIVQELPILRDRLPELIQRLHDAIAPLAARWNIKIPMDMASFQAIVMKHVSANGQELFTRMIASLQIGGGFLLTVVGNAILIPVVLFYLLMDWHGMLRRLHELIPPRLREGVMSFVHDCDHMMGQYLRGQLLVMAVLAVYYGAALWLAGFDLGLPVGIFTGLAVFIPYLGFGLGLILAILAAALQFGSWYGFIAVAVIYGVGQVVESIFLTPRLVGERIGLHPVVVIFALLAFGQLFGFIGVLIALPVSAIAAVALRRLKEAYFHSALFRG